MYVGVICTHCIRSESQLSISVRPCFAMGKYCLFIQLISTTMKERCYFCRSHLHPRQHNTSVLHRHTIAWIFFATSGKNKRNGKTYWWELSPLKLQSNNLPVLSFMHDRTLMPQIQYTTQQEVHYSWYPAVFITLSIN